jgi:ectoine hydroxylase-related dioxygenase (phytanoyl-CoA dioxygenase family)
MEIAASIHGPASAELAVQSEQAVANKATFGPPPTQAEVLARLDTTLTPRYCIDDSAWLEHLDREGYAVVAGAGDVADVARAEKLLWDFLEETTTWQRSSPESWTDEAVGHIGTTDIGIINGGGCAQSDFLWHVRTLPGVRQAFERIWSTDDLLVSFDGANIFRPWHHGFKKTVGGWWHVDQGFKKEGRHAVQGFVSLYTQNGETGGLTVVPRSHLRFAEVVEKQRQKNQSVDYCTVQPYSPVLRELPQRLVSCEPGDLVLWDSRTVHANAPAPQPPTAPANRLLRAVAYVCMTPKRFAKEEVRQGRRAAYQYRVGCSHWPHELNLGAVPNGGAQKSLDDATPEVRALVG